MFEVLTQESHNGSKTELELKPTEKGMDWSVCRKNDTFVEIQLYLLELFGLYKMRDSGL